MYKFKKLLSLALASLMLTGLLAACGNKPDSTPGSAAAPSDSTPADNTPAEETGDGWQGDVTNIVWYIGGNQPERPGGVFDALNEKSAREIGVTVDFKFMRREEDAVKAALASGADDIDIVFASSWFADYRTSAMNNYFVDLTDLLPAQAPTLYETIPDLLWDGIKVNDRIYGVPTWKDSAETLFWLGRTDIVEAAGAMDEYMNASFRLASMTPALQKIKDWHDEDPANNTYTEGTSAAIELNQRGDWSISFEWNTLYYDLEIGVKDFENPVVMSMYDDPDYIADLKTLKEWADSGISNGIAAMQMESTERPTIGRSVGWDGAQYTVWGGEGLGFSTTLNVAGGPILKSDAALGSSNCIPLNSKNVDASLRYLEYINTNAEYRNMLAYGIEGENFEVVDGKVKILTGDDYVTPNYTMASFEHLYAPVEVPNADMYKVICDSIYSAPNNPLMGFTPDLSAVQNEIAACTSIASEYSWPLHCGAVNDVDAAVAEYRARLDTLGYQAIIDTLQEQLEAHLAG